MVSGKYSVLAGAIAREQAIANISNNLANISTNGYKSSRVSFESLLKGQVQINQTKGINYSRVHENYTDYSEGAVRQTENPLDLSIHGSGFFKVQTAKGIHYTRRGDFLVNSDGLLTTRNGLPVLDNGNGEITIPDTDTSKVAVADNGTIYLLGPQGTRSEVGRLGIVDIPDTSKLKREADTTFSLADPAQERPANSYRILQGSLELSNVNMTSELSKMIESYRTFENYQKVLKNYSTISQQQEELGTL